MSFSYGFIQAWINNYFYILTNAKKLELNLNFGIIVEVSIPQTLQDFLKNRGHKYKNSEILMKRGSTNSKKRD